MLPPRATITGCWGIALGAPCGIAGGVACWRCWAPANICCSFWTTDGWAPPACIACWFCEPVCISAIFCRAIASSKSLGIAPGGWPLLSRSTLAFNGAGLPMKLSTSCSIPMMFPYKPNCCNRSATVLLLAPTAFAPPAAPAIISWALVGCAML